MLRFYAPVELRATWTRASELAATGMGGGSEMAKRLRHWAGDFLVDPTALPVPAYKKTSHAMVEDEGLAQEIGLHLQGVGKYFVAADVVRFMGQADVLARYGLVRPISERTARRWLQIMEYRYRKEAKGQYKDGHERDAVAYRVRFLAEWKELEECMELTDKMGNRRTHHQSLSVDFTSSPTTSRPSIPMTSGSSDGSTAANGRSHSARARAPPS